jgi:hypothetical protein
MQPSAELGHFKLKCMCYAIILHCASFIDMNWLSFTYSLLIVEAVDLVVLTLPPLTSQHHVCPAISVVNWVLGNLTDSQAPYSVTDNKRKISKRTAAEP